MPETTDTLVTGLRAWTNGHDPHVRAAVELLIWHRGWLGRSDFRKCLKEHSAEGMVTVNWRKARCLVDSGPQASTTELAVLDLAVALGENRYRLSSMGTAHREAIADAVRQAVGL
jgi:hypothetical protein